MNWNQFLISVSGIYCLYYAGNIAFDLLKPQAKAKQAEDAETLFFADDLVPELVVLDEEPQPENEDEQPDVHASSLPAPPFESTGGMRIMEFIASAKPDVYEYTRAISY